jgi:hypothetical protein
MLLAPLLIPAGILVIVKSAQIGDFIGEITFAEKVLGSGGTYTFIKLFGVATTILSIMWLTGGPQEFLRDHVGKFFGVS